MQSFLAFATPLLGYIVTNRNSKGCDLSPQKSLFVFQVANRNKLLNKITKEYDKLAAEYNERWHQKKKFLKSQDHQVQKSFQILEEILNCIILQPLVRK